MNIRKPVDYSAMFATLDALMAADLPQMELYCEIGRLVSGRPEKGAAVAVAEYLCATYPDAAGFSPRNLRRMREFYRTYENAPKVLAVAMTIGWTQNVVILEAELSLQERMWYIQAAHQFGWSKLEIQRQIESCAHLSMALDFPDEVCYTEKNTASFRKADEFPMCRKILCFGDSNTYGYDPRSYLGGRYPDTVRWTALLDQQGWKVFNAGENGRSIPRREWELEAAFQTIRRSEPDLVTIMLGGNDLLQDLGLGAEDCAARMERFLKGLLVHDLLCEFLLIAPPPMTFGAWVNDSRTVETSDALAGRYQAAAGWLGIHFVDAGTWGVGLTFDGVHFSEAGHRAFADGIAQVLKRIGVKPIWKWNIRRNW